MQPLIFCLSLIELPCSRQFDRIVAHYDCIHCRGHEYEYEHRYTGTTVVVSEDGTTLRGYLETDEWFEDEEKHGLL